MPREDSFASEKDIDDLASILDTRLGAIVDALVTAGTVLIQDQKPIGMEGGTATNGAWRTRDQNTIVYDADGLVISLIANQIRLAAGFYDVCAWANGLRVGFHQIRLRNITDSTTLLTGLNERSITTDSTTTTATLAGPITLASAKVLELQHRVSTTQATFGFGADLQAGFDINVFSSILFRKA